MNEVSKTTNKKQETLKPTNQKRNLTTCTNQKSLEPKPVLPTANQTTVVTLLNQNFAFPLVLKQTPYFLFPTKNTPLSKVTSHSSSVSIPTNHSSPVSVSTNHSSHVFIPTNHSSPGSIPTNRKPSKSKFCCLCDERFKHQTLLLSHLDQHALKGEEPRYDCLHCEQSFTGSTTLMSLNVESLSVLCSVLGSTLLRIHQRTHVPPHTKLHGEKRFLCHTCGRGFVSRVALRSHVRTHTGERPYTCTLCGRGFAFNAGLKVHLRRHLGDKPYTCSVCGKGFPSGGDLQAHARTHTVPAQLK
uniref:C2H2-type domain-containing protein n=1 Tax=Periophthalmus magnuspinnatus TaxID=409849 RepID=A0A3B3ZW61_9GOBI